MKELIAEISKLDDVIVISSFTIQQSIKDYIYQNKLFLNIRYKTFNDVVKDFYGYYSKEALVSLVLEKEVNPEIAKILLDNTFYVSNENYQNEKLNELRHLKEKYSPYLQRNNFAINFYHGKQILLINPDYTNILFVKLLEDLQMISELKVINLNQKYEKPLKVYCFNSIKEEVEALAFEVSKLINQGIDPLKIKIHNLNDNYLPVFYEVFNFYSLDVDFNSSKVLFEYDLVKKFLSILSEKLHDSFNEIIDESLENLKSKVNINNPSVAKIYNSIISILNQYAFFNGKVEDIISILEYEFKNSSIKINKHDNVIRLTNVIDDYIKPDDYVFFLGLNQDILPQIIRDEDYLFDSEKDFLGFKTTTFINKHIKEKLKRSIDFSKNIYLSYSLNSLEAKLQRSSFIDILKKDYQVKEIHYEKNVLLSYSRLRDKFNLAKLFDQYYLYDVKSDELFILYDNLGNINYLAYQNDFTGIDECVLNNHIENEFYLSFTSIDSFYNCGFKYYLERILKIKKSTNERSLMIGNFFHYALEKLITENQNDFKLHLDEITDNFTKEYGSSLSVKDRFYFEIYKEHIGKIYNIIKLQFNRSSFKIHSLEANHRIVLNHPLKPFLIGKIDKVLTHKIGGQNYAIVMDYKTGRNDFNYNKAIHGLDLQTLIYFYLINKSSSEKFLFAGAYLQSLFPSNPFLYNPNLSYDEQLKEYLKWNGYTVKDFSVIEFIDPFFNSDGFLKGIRQKKDLDFHYHSLNKVLTLEEFENLQDLLEEKIYQCVEDISRGLFSINPKKARDLDSCQYCNYKDICFRKEKDYIKLEISQDLEFIRTGVDNSDSK